MKFSKPIKAIFWDNDGVLVDTERIFLAANRQVLSRYGVRLTDADFLRISLGEGRSVLSLADHLVPGHDGHRRLSDERNGVYAQMLADVGPEIVNPGVMAALDYFHGKLIMGIVTSCRRGHFELIHRRTGIPGYMDFILGLEDFTNSKPDPEPYLLALERSGCRADECVAVEDSARGIEAAAAAGITVIAIPHELSPKDSLSAADIVLDGVSELIHLLPTCGADT